MYRLAMSLSYLAILSYCLLERMSYWMVLLLVKLYCLGLVDQEVVWVVVSGTQLQILVVREPHLGAI